MVVVGRNGAIPVPIHLVLEYEDGATQTVHHTAAVWKDGKQQFKVFCPQGKKVKKATIIFFSVFLLFV